MSRKKKIIIGVSIAGSLILGYVLKTKKSKTIVKEIIDCEMTASGDPFKRPDLGCKLIFKSKENGKSIINSYLLSQEDIKWLINEFSLYIPKEVSHE